FFQAEDGIRDWSVTGVQTCALPIYGGRNRNGRRVFEGPRLRRMAWAGTETNLDWRPNNPRPHIKTGQSLSARPVRPGGLGGVGRSEERRVGKEWRARREAYDVEKRG